MLPIIHFPIIPEVRVLADDYAYRSGGFTANKGKFKNDAEWSRYRHRLNGQIIQRLFANLLSVNDVDGVFDDKTNYTECDKFDLKIRNTVFDAKGTQFHMGPMQVPAYQTEYDMNGFYLYGTIDWPRDRWTPHGFIRKKDAIKEDRLIREGELIPHMNRNNSINSYFVPIHVEGWHSWIRLADDVLIKKLKKLDCEKFLPAVMEQLAMNGVQKTLF